jgi:hypothetical protein
VVLFLLNHLGGAIEANKPNVVPQAALEPTTPASLVQTGGFPAQSHHHSIVSGSTGLCINPLCTRCQAADAEAECAEGLADVNDHYYRAEPYWTESWQYYKEDCNHRALKLIHPYKRSIALELLPRPVIPAREPFVTSASTDPAYTLDSHGYEFLWINHDHADWTAYKRAVATLKELIQSVKASSDEDEIAKVGKKEEQHVHDVLFATLKKQVSKALNCDSIRLLDNLRYVDRSSGSAVNKRVQEETKELIRVRAGQGHALLEKGWDPHEGLIEVAPNEYRFPVGDEEKNQDDEEEKVEQTELHLGMADLSVMVPNENHDDINDDVAWADIASEGCTASAKALPVLHVDPYHATELRSIRTAAKGKEVHFASWYTSQNQNNIYREMYNIWIFLSDKYCALPLGFDKRPNKKSEGGLKHINNPNEDESTNTLVHAHMKSGDMVLFRTLDVAHSALKVYDDSVECQDLKADCRMSVEIRIFGYGDNSKPCKGVL